jgi:hypothetical protein
MKILDSTPHGKDIERRIIKIKKKIRSWMKNLPKDLKRKFVRRLRNP